MEPLYIALETSKDGGKSPHQVKQYYDIVCNNIDKLPKIVKEYIGSRKIVVISENILVPQKTVPIYLNDMTMCIYVSNNPYLFPEQMNNNIIYLGIDQDLIPDENIEILNNGLANYFTIQKCKTLGFKKIYSVITELTKKSQKLHLVLDLRIFDNNVAPSVIRDKMQKHFVTYENIFELISVLESIYFLDIVGFDDSIDDEYFKLTKITGTCCRNLIKKIFNLKEKSINIFTEDSKFLIFRPVEQYEEIEDMDDSVDDIDNGDTDDTSDTVNLDEEINKMEQKDIGWYIVKFLTLEQRENILSQLGDKVITISIPKNDNEEIDMYVTSTTINEQNMKSYYCAKSIYDFCLFPKEKLSMTMELLNTQ